MGLFYDVNKEEKIKEIKKQIDKMGDFQEFVDWYLENPEDRNVKIELRGHYDSISIWMYDFKLQEGLHVNKVCEWKNDKMIKEKIKVREREIERLKDMLKKE